MVLDRRFVRTAVALAVFAGATSMAAQDSATAVPSRASADSTFTEEQAERGNQVFVRVCVECHERVEMSNNDFRLKWSGQSTFDLFKSISTTMPDSDPGGLPRGEYTAVVAYILKLNGVPSGLTELVEDSTAMSQHKLTLPQSTSDASAARRAGEVAPRAQLGHRAFVRPGSATRTTPALQR
ncbi:MAG: c-type cytochrome [Gemmatimonadetes bacterium]|nr:c-type cytochrome [Gemmatimonadota bacterium]MCC6774157.1 c-type cytochrome [Gemmatimonadaceae bacterium]